MKLPDEYFELDPCDDIPRDKFRLHTLRGFSLWVEDNSPKEIEMTERQFWNFTKLQPIPHEERYWSTFHGIPLRVPEMTEDQIKRLRLDQ